MTNNDYEKYLNHRFVSENKISYTINAFLNQGGNGYIYDCITEKGETYVVKVLHDTGKKNIKENNFKKEIELLKKLNSPYIVKCVDSGVLRLDNQKKDRCFYVMKKYAKTLEQMINDDEITPISAYKYSIQLCKALKEMHKRADPLIHRDLKPENILYDEKEDNLLLCDLGLTHVERNTKTINDGFVGNVDYHAPEQKIRGAYKVGTYTDIYALGLIINVLFTKEIPAGENYKKVWECAPYFHFVDDIIDKMIQHDYLKRENDINSILIELNKHEIDFKVEESILKPKCSQLGIPLEKVEDVMNLYALSTYFLKNDINDIKSKIVNYYYYCDYHFKCSDNMRNYLLLCMLHKRIQHIFESEISEYNQSSCINLNNNEDRILFNKLNEEVINRNTFEEAGRLKANIKKYFQCIYNYHAKEFIDSISRVEDEINYYCLDAPILCIAFFIKENIYELGTLLSSNFIELVDYKSSEVINKNILFFDKNIELKDFGRIIRTLIKDSSYIIDNGRIKVYFESVQNEEKFEELLKNIKEKLPQNDIRRYDINDIIYNAEMEPLKKAYIFDSSDVQVVLNNLEL